MQNAKFKMQTPYAGEKGARCDAVGATDPQQRWSYHRPLALCIFASCILHFASVKPYHPRRMAEFSFGPFVLDAAANRLLRDGVEVKMRAQAIAVLRTLVARGGQFLTHDQFIQEAWDGTIVSRHTVNVTIGEVRKLLDDYGSWIVWRPKVGYSLRVPQSDTLVRLGWHFVNLRSCEGFERAVECFSNAAAEAPRDHRTFEGLASCYLMMASFGVRSGREMLQAFLAAHQRAVALVGLTPLLRCHYAHAIHMYQRRLDEALIEFDRAIAEQPQMAVAHVRRTLLLVTRGDLDAALDSAARARAADPLQPLTAAAELSVSIWRREFDRAVALGERAVQLHPYFMLARAYCGMALEYAGRPEAALEQYHIGGVLTQGLAWMRGLEGSCLAKLGREADARAILDELLERRRHEYVDAYAVARLRFALGDADGAFIELDRAIDDNVSGLYAIRFDPSADAFRNDRRFARLLKRYLEPAAHTLVAV
jgi:DNA-binding winged helix-turn-helix (wHTH) protein/tetratricopeptide (TPR) repeat protein